MGNTINSYLRGVLLAHQQAAQIEQLLAARQSRTIQGQQAQRAEELFPLQKQQAEMQIQQEQELNPLRKRQAELGIQTGEAGLEKGKLELDTLRLQNQRLKKMMEAFTDPKALEGIKKEADSLNLTPEEKLGLNVSLQESAQSFDLTPARTYIKDVILERGRNRRSDNQQREAEERLNRAIDAADRRFFAGLGERQRQFEQRAGSEEDSELAANRIATGEAKLTDFSVNARPRILRKLEGSRIVPPKAREELKKIGQAESIVDQFEKTLLDFVEDKSAKNAFRLSTQRNAFARKLGRALGEVGVFTDQDKQDFARLLSPGGVVIAAVSDDIAFQAIDDMRELFNRVRQREIEGVFREFPRDGGKPKEAPKPAPSTNDRIKELLKDLPF